MSEIILPSTSSASQPINSPYLIDSHCHLHDTEWYSAAEAENALSTAAAAGVRQIIVIGTDPEDSHSAEHFASAHAGVYHTFGIHPEFTDHLPADSSSLIADSFQQISSSPSLVAIGEIGLDYHYCDTNRREQIHLFEQLLQLALDQELPVSLHIREAFDDALAVLANFPQITGVVHSFTGSKKVLKALLERDFYIGVNGLATYTTNPLPPVEKMLLETDAPFLTPVPFRGTMNVPAHIREIATSVAGKLGLAPELIAEETTKNVQTLFRIPSHLTLHYPEPGF